MSTNIDKALENLDTSFNEVSAVLKNELPEVWEKAVSLFDSEAKATQWLTREVPALDGKRPCTLAFSSDEGKEQVLEVINRLEHGFNC